MGYTEQTYTYQCQYCQNMVVVKKIPELGIVENDENVSIYQVRSESGLIRDVPVCSVCVQIIEKIVDKKLSPDTKDKK